MRLKTVVVSLLLAVWAASTSAQTPLPDDPRSLAALEKAAGGPVRISRSRQTGYVGFLRAPRGRAIPVPDPAAVDAPSRARSFLAVHGGLFGLPGVDELETLREERDETRMDHVRFRQVRGGVPVTGSGLSVHMRDGRVTSVNGKILPGRVRVPLTPAVDATRAKEAAQQLLASRLKVSDAELSEPQLEIFDLGFIGGPPRPARLAWFIEARKIDLWEYIWVDAQKGSVLKHWSQLFHARHRKIYDANHTDSLPGTLISSDSGPAPSDVDAAKAYEYSGDWYDYFKNTFNRDSFDGKGATIIATVRYREGSLPYENAFWNKTQVVFGDGLPTGDDVVGHELTHAITQYTAGLYGYMQSGALNESYSDIFGETIDLGNSSGTDTSAVKWKMGEDTVIGAFRDMKNPGFFNHPARMSDPTFVCTDNPPKTADGGGIHANAGVTNHAYVLMSEGGTYNGITVGAITRDKAARIEYRALTQHLLPASDFLDNYDALLTACDDLVGTFGITLANCGEVQKALDAVEMSDPWPCAPTQATVPAFCPIGQAAVDLFSDGFENMASGQWTTQILPGGGSENHWTGGSGSPDIYFNDFPKKGARSLWGYDKPSVGDAAVTMANFVTIPNDAPNARMQFNHSWGFDNDGGIFYSGGVLEYLNGVSWFSAAPRIIAGGDVGGAIASGNGNPLQGMQAFVGESWGYTATQLNLNAFIGNSLKFRFRIGTDNNPAEDYGWFIDDVRIYFCDVGGSVELSAPTYNVGEGAGTATITAVRTGGKAPGATVHYATSNGTATAPSDYTTTTGVLTFAANVTSRTFTVAIQDDFMNDENENFGVSLTSVGGPSTTLGATTSATVNIADNDVPGTLQFSPAVFTSPENAGQAAITVTRTGGMASGVSVQFATSDGTATVADSDYASTAGTLQFSGGVTSRTFGVQLMNDTLDEPTETVGLTLFSPTGGATLGTTTSAVLKITDDDAGGSLHWSTGPASVVEGGGITLTVTRTAGLASGVTVDFTTGDGTAVAGADYNASSGTLSFGAGKTVKTVNLTTIDDSAGESNETFKVTLTNPQGGATLGTPATKIVTVTENERVVQFSLPKYTVAEGVPTAVITATRNGDTTGTVMVNYAASPGTATNTSDFTAIAGTLTFGATVTSRTFKVAIANDAIREDPESVVLTLTTPTNGAVLGPRKTAVLIINDEDPLLQFSLPEFNGTEASGQAAITVVRTGSTGSAVGVSYQMTDGTATDGLDYAATSGTLAFGVGVTSRTFMITLLPDSEGEPTETVSLLLSAPTGDAGLGAQSSAVLNIVDNDSHFRFSMASYSAGESLPAATVTVTRGTGADAATVDFSTSAGTATTTTDYTETSGTLTFGVGMTSQTFAVTLAPDTDPEGTETVALALSNPSAPTALGTPSTAELRIVDNDFAGGLLQFSTGAYPVGEAAGTATITVKRTAGTAGAVSIVYATSDGTATVAGGDYTSTSGVLNFSAGASSKTFKVKITNDTTDDDGETIALTLSSPSGGAGLGVPSTATITITDDDGPGVLALGAPFYSVTEGAGAATIGVLRTGGLANGITVDYATADGTATTADGDYSSTSGTLTFGAGQVLATFSVPITNDVVTEAVETIGIAISNPQGGATLGTTTSATVHLLDEPL